VVMTRANRIMRQAGGTFERIRVYRFAIEIKAPNS
jgi:hypothetical protein